MKTPEPIRRVFASPRGLIVLVVVITATVAQLLDLGLWGIALVVLAGWFALTVELWIDAIRKDSQLEAVKSEMATVKAELEAASESLADASLRSSDASELREEVRRLRAEAAGGALTLQRLLGGIAGQRSMIEVVQRQRMLRASGSGELLVTAVRLTGDTVLVSAHAPLGGDDWDAEFVTLVDGQNAIQGNGIVVGTTDDQVAAQLALNDVVDPLREELERAGAVDPDGYRILPWGLTLTPYLALGDDALEDVRIALAECADAIAIAFVHEESEGRPRASDGNEEEVP